MLQCDLSFILSIYKVEGEANSLTSTLHRGCLLLHKAGYGGMRLFGKNNVIYFYKTNKQIKQKKQLSDPHSISDIK